MKAPTSTLGKAVVAGLAIFGGSWLGAAVNSRRVAKRNPSGASAAAAFGATTGGLIVTAAGAGLAMSKNEWNGVGQMTALLGSLGYAAAAIGGIGPIDRVLAKGSGSQPKILTASTADSGKTFALNVGDSLAVALPAAQSGATWKWTETPSAGVVNGPSQSTQAVAGGSNEIDTFVGSGNGTVTLAAALTPSGGGAATATWTATVVVGNGVNPPVVPATTTPAASTPTAA